MDATGPVAACVLAVPTVRVGRASQTGVRAAPVLGSAGQVDVDAVGASIAGHTAPTVGVRLIQYRRACPPSRVLVVAGALHVDAALIGSGRSRIGDSHNPESDRSGDKRHGQESP